MAFIYKIILVSSLFAQDKPIIKTISNENASIEIIRKGDSTYFRAKSKEKVVLSPECEQWELSPDSIFINRWGGADYPGYSGCFDTELPLDSAFYILNPLSIRDYIERLYYPITFNSYNNETLTIVRQDTKDSIVIRSKKELLEFENKFPKIQYFDSYGSGAVGLKISRFTNGIHYFNLTLKLDCEFTKENPNSNQNCEPDYSKVWWKGKIVQKFQIVKTDTSYIITKK
jgi:hypothetical protein